MMVRMHSVRRLRYLLCLPLLAVFVHAPARAQSPQAELAAKWSNKTIYFRDRWAGADLRFKADGSPEKDGPVTPFPLAAVQIRSIAIKNDGLSLDCVRFALAFDEKDRMRALRMDETVHVTVDGHPGQDFGPAMDAIFAPDLFSLIPSLPSYWQFYARKHFAPAGAISQVSDAAAIEQKIEERRTHHPASHPGAYTVPKATHADFPELSVESRRMRYSGDVTLYLWVDEHGDTTHLSIVKAAGVGLDEKAMEAVQRYKFTPATLDGKPVKTDILLKISFENF